MISCMATKCEYQMIKHWFWVLNDLSHSFIQFTISLFMVQPCQMIFICIFKTKMHKIQYVMPVTLCDGHYIENDLFAVFYSNKEKKNWLYKPILWFIDNIAMKFIMNLSALKTNTK